MWHPQLFVFFQHLLLFVKVMISYMIPDQPEWVETAVARVQYQSKQAWRKEVSKLMYLRQSTAFTANNNIFIINSSILFIPEKSEI